MINQPIKKSLVVKAKAINRTLKQFKAYKLQTQSFNLTQVSQNKKQSQFYTQSLSALQTVKKNLIEFIQQFQTMQNQYNDAIVQAHDPSLDAELEKANLNVKEARSLLPAEC